MIICSDRVSDKKLDQTTKIGLFSRKTPGDANSKKMKLKEALHKIKARLTCKSSSQSQTTDLVSSSVRNSKSAISADITALPLADSADLKDIVCSTTGLSLSTPSVIEWENITCFLQSNQLKDRKLTLWRELINNTISPCYKINHNRPLQIGKFNATLEAISILHGVVYCEREGAPIFFR